MINELPIHVDLFSGIGGFALAAQWAGFRTIAFCEIDRYCRQVLAKNFLADAESTRSSRTGGESQSEGAQQQFSNGHPEITSNIFDFDGTTYRGCDLITGGFPCQPFSVAGKRRGAADDRALWPEMFRVIKEARPAWVLGENVPGIIPMELDNVLSDLEGIGYACRPFVIPACAVDARHRRDRLWIVANSSERRFGGTDGWEIQFERRTETQCGSETVCDSAGERLSVGTSLPMGTSGELQSEPQRSSSNVPQPTAKRLQEQRTSREQEPQAHERTGLPVCGGEGRGHAAWPSEPDVGRVAHGIPSRVDRLKGLGNAIVPQVAYEILREIRKLMAET
jgi:DNA (cytosine-5)-methyltransferase 1